MYVFPASHLDVHTAIEPGRAREQDVFEDLICSKRCPFCSWRRMAAYQCCQEAEISAEKHKRAEKYFEVLGNLEPNFQQICLKRAENVSN
jgi:hypothetical protein